MKKSYVLDTNVLLEDPNCIRVLRNGVENEIGIPFHVILELDKLKKEPRLQHLVAAAIKEIRENLDGITILRNKNKPTAIDTIDLHILEEVRHGMLEDPVLVTNDQILQLLADFNRVDNQEYKSSHPFESESQRYTGFVEDEDDIVPNCFRWKEGKPEFHGADGPRIIDYEHEIWKVKPRNIYQNLAFELLLNEQIDIVTLQSAAGYGKTYLALAAALFLALQKKQYEKIYVVKPMIEIGTKMGYLPGDIKEKMEPYVQYMVALVNKLHKTRPAERIFMKEEATTRSFNKEKFEILPLAFIRGMNIEDAIVIIDETQNLSRMEIRALLTRMGQNVRCYCLGDTSQVDNPYLNPTNNALNWIVQKFKGMPNYGHLVLKGAKSRGPICDMVLKSGL